LVNRVIYFNTNSTQISTVFSQKIFPEVIFIKKHSEKFKIWNIDIPRPLFRVKKVAHFHNKIQISALSTNLKLFRCFETA